MRKVMTTKALEFEKPITEIQEKIEELKKVSLESGMDLSKEIETFEKQANEYKKELYENLKPSQKLLIARHPSRPNFLEYVKLMTDDFIELHGDRAGMDDRAMIGGLAKLGGRSIMLIGTQKGKSTKENLEYNFGMPQPQGYRKALKLFNHANKFNLPIVTLIDTPGAYPGITAEETGQGIAIAVNLREMSKMNVPIIAVITGEGCSGGALGLGVADKVLILEHAYYTVITPEGCASILWRDAAMANTAADALKITGPELTEFKIVDEVVKEPIGGAHTNHEEMANTLKEAIIKNLDELSKFSPEELRQNRYDKYRKMGVTE
jgi:acetyl-CoA carboxylase carboxyl transferase subunit alpha